LNKISLILKKILADKISATALIIFIVYLITGIVCESYNIISSTMKTTPIYQKSNIDNRNKPPSKNHILGTDYSGKDVFWKGLFSIPTALKVGIIGSGFAAFIGVILGILAGYFGGKIDDLVVWIYTTFAAMPTLLLILAFAMLIQKGFLPESINNIFKFAANILNVELGMLALYIGIGLTGWVTLCRVTRSETMKLKELGYVQAAKTLGYSNLRIMSFHLLPNLFHLVIIYFTMRFAYAVMTEVIVSYLGLGVQMTPSWGKMIADGQQQLWHGVWWEVTTATAFMFFLVLSLHILGDKLRDILDPQLNESN
jgi:peptide/nickel transport system permease protein